MDPRRCACLLMTAGAVGHHAFELGAGAGIMLQREVGLPAASGGWALAFSGLAAVSWRGSARWDPALAVAAGANLAAVTVHFTLWPWRIRCGVPVLTSAEGLAAGHLPAYNTILLGWGAAALAAALGNRRCRPWAVAGFLAFLPLRRDARHHFAWMREQARTRPAWWNRALQ